MSDIEHKYIDVPPMSATDTAKWALDVLADRSAPVGRRLVARTTLEKVAAEADALRGAVDLLAEAESLLQEAADLVAGGEHEKRLRAFCERIATTTGGSSGQF